MEPRVDRARSLCYDHPVPVLLFDLDNTLYPQSLGVVARIDQRINDYLHVRVGIPASEVDGLRRRFWIEHGTTLAGLAAEHSVDQDDYLEYVHDIGLADLLKPDPTLGAMLERLPGRKVVFSNASRAHAERVLARLCLEKPFESVIGLEDLGYVPKPHAAAFRSVLERLGASAEHCSLIDDLRANLAAAKRLGMRTIWVAEAGRDRADETIDHVVADVREIERVLVGASSLGV
ncbi:MAG TPA: pyrimidine 5'-nucleotidase [Candidatus Binatia bacterium]|nr:pyrimidine 5'-nucleotidase [Candidatus Binatia bacterium]